MSLPSALETQPPTVPNVTIAFPAPHILLITLNRPAQLNAIPSSQHAALAALYDWYDAEPHLRCAVLTGAGRAFCAGADLREWDALNGTSLSASVSSSPRPDPGPSQSQSQGSRPGQENMGIPPAGFGGLSNRAGKKPVIAAVNGLCLGGGMEMVINCDIVLAARSARFGLPEVTRGVIAVAGALPRLAHTVGRQRAAEMALLGRQYGAEEMAAWGLVNWVVGDGEVVNEALKTAEEVARNSPDAVVVSREGIRSGGEGLGPRAATEVLAMGMYARMDRGENMLEGVRSFVEKRKPVWKDTKL